MNQLQGDGYPFVTIFLKVSTFILFKTFKVLNSMFHFKFENKRKFFVDR